jgi:dipeptidase D
MPNREALAGLEPAALWAHFAELTTIARPSGQEAAAAAWLSAWARRRGFAARQDAAGNLCLAVPASPDAAGAPAVALQAHLDMVCVRAEGGASDPAAGRIEIAREGEWIVAPESTLGADNGIGIAAALCAAESDAVRHGPLELLFTVQEETSFGGADALDPDMVSARLMLNLDAESIGSLWVGCAGAGWTVLRFPLPDEPLPPGWHGAQITLSGLTGGHSGMDIARDRLNAVKSIVLLVRELAGRTPLRLCGLEGGAAINAIPIHAQATVALPPDGATALTGWLDSARAGLRTRAAASDPGLSLTCDRDVPAPTACWGVGRQKRLLDLLERLPSGVLSMEQQVPELVETSSNLGIVAPRDGRLEIHSLSRSSVPTVLQATLDSIESLAAQAGAEFSIVPPVTPAWRGDPDSPLLRTLQQAYRDLFQREPGLGTVHAALECGLLMQRLPGLDVVAIGPDIRRPHMPGERVSVPSVRMFYDLLAEVLGRLASYRTTNA